MSRIFKSNYVKVGTPKPIKSDTPEIMKPQETRPMEIHQAQSLEERANSIIEDAKQMYLRIIEEANSEAQKIVEAANQEAEAIFAETAERGYNEGYAAGYNEGMQQTEAVLNQAAGIREELDARHISMYDEAEKEIMQMVLDISRKVLGDELTQNPDVILLLIRQALEKCAFKDKLIIRVSEQDYEHVISNKNKIVMLTEGLSDLEISCDMALPKGSCIVETTSGEINAGLHVQMNEIQKAFEYIVRNE